MTSPIEEVLAGIGDTLGDHGRRIRTLEGNEVAEGGGGGSGIDDKIVLYKADGTTTTYELTIDNCIAVFGLASTGDTIHFPRAMRQLTLGSQVSVPAGVTVEYGSFLFNCLSPAVTLNDLSKLRQCTMEYNAEINDVRPKHAVLVYAEASGCRVDGGEYLAYGAQDEVAALWLVGGAKPSVVSGATLLASDPECLDVFSLRMGNNSLAIGCYMQADDYSSVGHGVNVFATANCRIVDCHVLVALENEERMPVGINVTTGGYCEIYQTSVITKNSLNVYIETCIYVMEGATALIGNCTLIGYDPVYSEGPTTITFVNSDRRPVDQVKGLAGGTYNVLIGGPNVFMCNASDGGITINLPTAGVVEGVTYIVKKQIGANNVTIDPYGDEQIDGLDTLVISTVGEVKRIISDGSGWQTV